MSVANPESVEQELPINASDGGGDSDVGGTEGVDGAKREVQASAGVGSRSSVYGPEEISTLRGIFSLCGAQHTGTVAVKDLEGILQKVGYSPGVCVFTSRQLSRRGRISTFLEYAYSRHWYQRFSD